MKNSFDFVCDTIALHFFAHYNEGAKGKIPGAIKEGRKWLIPDDAVRPVDKRVSSGKYAKKKVANNKSLPIGISDYVRAQADYYRLEHRNGK